MATGVIERHRRSCPARDGESRCACPGGPTYTAWVYSKADRRKIRRSFHGRGAKTAAKQWRASAIGQVREGTMRVPKPTTIREALTACLDGMDAGTIRTRGGDPYKPSVRRSYRTSAERRLIPAVGAKRLADFTRVEAQDLADRWAAQGLDASTIRNAFMPLRVVYRRALARGEVSVNPVAALELPAVAKKRDRVLPPEEAALLIGVLDDHDAAVWATAFYAGLRLGELKALRWEDVDLDLDEIRVSRGWDVREGEVAPKSKAGTRRVPVVRALRTRLLAQRVASGRRDGMVFGPDGAEPFNYGGLMLRTRKAWKRLNERRAEQELAPVEPLTPHEARHTAASLMIAAGCNLKTIQTALGHSSITETMDRYGHLLPGAMGEARALLDAFLDAAEGGA